MVRVEWFARSRSDGPVGVCTRVFARLQIVSCAAAQVAELPHESMARAELLRVLDMYRSYDTFRIAYASVPTLGLIDAVCVAQDTFDRMQERLRYVAKTLNKLLFEVFACSGEHDDNIRTLCKSHAGIVAMLEFDNWDSTTCSSMADAARMLAMNTLTVHANAGTALPPASARERKIWHGVSIDRYSVLKCSQYLRRSYFNVGAFKRSTAQGMTECPDGD